MSHDMRQAVAGCELKSQEVHSHKLAYFSNTCLLGRAVRLSRPGLGRENTWEQK